MATTGKKRGRPPKKKSATATEITNKRKKPNYAVKMQVTAVLLFTAAIFFLCVVFIDGRNPDGSGNVWTALHDFIFGIFGVCAYVWPVMLGLVSVLCALDKLYGSVTAKLVESSVVVVLVGAAVNIFRGDYLGVPFFEYLGRSYTQGIEISGGGFLGAFIGYPIGALFGKTGASITVCLLIFLFVMLATGTTLIAFFKNVFFNPAKKIGETAEHMIQNRENTKKVKDEDDAPPFKVDIPIDESPNIPPREIPADTAEKILEKKNVLLEKYHQLNDSEAVDITVEDKTGKKPKKEPKIEPQEPEAEEEKKQTVSGVEFVTDENTYRFPPLSLLNDTVARSQKDLNSEKQAIADKLVETLRDFKVETKVINITVGPAVTRYELQPSAGVKVSKITNLADDIALNLATDGVRIEAPIPNKPAIGIEVPNKTVSVVGVKEIIDSPEFSSAKSKISFAVGKDIAGNPVVADIAKMPHGLIAGATNSGKSVCINSLIISILYKASPDDVKFLMIDPKMVELGNYDGIPHLLVPVVTDPKKAAGALGWAVTEMDKRYKLFSEYKVRDVFSYNELAEQTEDMIKMPQVVIIIDELADLMMTASHEVEAAICRLAQKARAAGMHLIIATQRPSVNVITGVIKANIPTRIAFMVSSQVDSRTILDMGGAEKLIGRGDMLFHPVGLIKPKRVQGCFVSDKEIAAVVDFVKNGSQENTYDEEVMAEIERQAVKEKSAKGDGDGDDLPEGFDPMLGKAIECVVHAGKASTSLLQTRVRLGYARASRIIDEMEQMGIVGPYEGSKPRQVLITEEQLMEMKARDDTLFR